MKKLNLGNRKVQIGIASAVAFLFVAIIVGNQSTVNKNETESAVSDTIEDYNTPVVEEVVEVIGEPEPDNYTSDNANDAQPEAETEPGTSDTPEARSNVTPAETPHVSDEQIRKEIDRETDISQSDDKEYSMGVIGQKPEFPGGESALYDYLSSHINYPAQAAEEGVQGRVIVQFTITKTGKIENVSVVRGRHPALDKEALRVVKSMPNWTPGRQDGRAVNVQHTLPITFRLS
ncbi:MAG: energy transducer TonB [Muribaculaceae bacterium]